MSMIHWIDNILGNTDRSEIVFDKKTHAEVRPWAVLDSNSPTGAKAMWKWDVSNGDLHFSGTAPSRDAAKAQVERVIREEIDVATD